MEQMHNTSTLFSSPSYESVSRIPSDLLDSTVLDLPASRKRNLWFSVAGMAIALLIVAGIGVIALYSYIAWALARPAVAPLQSNPLTTIGLPYEDISFTSENGGHPLEGWYIPAAEASSRTMIFSHGYGGNREEIWVPIYELARFAHEQGYNALMFDYEYVYHHDRVVTGGAKESGDLLGAVNYVESRGAEQVIVWGFSMGAGTALQAALLSDQIDAMILDSTFILEPDTLYHNLRQYADLPREPSLTLLRWLYPLMNGSGMNEVPYQEIKRTAYEIPTFMIHGTLDERSPYEIIRGVAQNQMTANPLSDFWLVPNATHELVYRYDKETYMSKVSSFLHRIAN